MTKKALPTTNTLLAAAAGLALALTAVACSGTARDSEASPNARATPTTTRTAETAGADAAPVRLATAEFDVEGMTCGGCALATEMAVKKLTGVASADAGYDEATGQGRATVEYDPSVVTTDAIAAAIAKAGYTPTLNSTDERG